MLFNKDSITVFNMSIIAFTINFFKDGQWNSSLPIVPPPYIVVLKQLYTIYRRLSMGGTNKKEIYID